MVGFRRKEAEPGGGGVLAVSFCGGKRYDPAREPRKIPDVVGGGCSVMHFSRFTAVGTEGGLGGGGEGQT